MIERHFAAHLAFNGATTRQLAALVILQYEKIVASVDWRTLGESGNRGIDLGRQEFAIVG